VKKIITINNDKYEILGTVSARTNYSPEELKKQWNADTVLRNGKNLYMTRKLIEAEFKILN
tara:strand:+ start:557 stop:739 length:183 start_codon:yes stop_codon:yes gene_type:complete